MLHLLRSLCSTVLVALTCASLLVTPAQAASAPQYEALPTGTELVDRLGSESESIETTFVGSVVDTDGVPLAGAVVVTSAGGRAVTAEDGSFRLDVRLPAASTSVHVTAVAGSGSGTTLASTRIATLTAGGTIATGPLTSRLTSGCQPEWLPTFHGRPGVSNTVRALAAFDDGTGVALYAGGSFTIAGGVSAMHVAKWNGSTWSSLDTGVGAGGSDAVEALAVFDDGSGPALYAGGSFQVAGGVPASNIAKWDGSAWSAVGAGLDGGGVRALLVFDDGAGPALYAGGAFVQTGGAPVDRIAKWDGASWSALGSGLNDTVAALAAFDDGTGPGLYAGGAFTSAGGVPVSRIARWDGSTWSDLAGGITSGAGSTVLALTVFDDGGGPDLYAGGRFTSAGGVAVRCIARWDGTSWSALFGPVNGTVRGLAVFDDGAGPALYATGDFVSAGFVAANRIAKWDGTSWSPLGSGLNLGPSNGGSVALLVYDDGAGEMLHVGGGFTTAGGLRVNYVAAWDGSGWLPLGGGIDDAVLALGVFDDGGGPALYAGGNFTTIDGVFVNHVARWDGTAWSALAGGVGVPYSGQNVRAFAVYDDGSGPALYAGGSWTVAGVGSPSVSIAKWDGSSWSVPDQGVFGFVFALTTYDDGTGEALYVGGQFTNAGFVTVHNIAKWDGSSWSSLFGGTNASVDALAVFDDGSGPGLYAGGAFSVAGGVSASSIARWDGSSWSALGSGVRVGAGVFALREFDDGSGPALFVGGIFQTAGGAPANSIARWDGSSWTSLGNGPSSVLTMAVFDDGSAPALYTGGYGVDFARWDGSSWSFLPGTLSDTTPGLRALAVFDDGTGPALYAGGTFLASPAGDSYLAKWGNAPSCGTPGTSSCEPGSGGVIACPCGNAPAASGLGCDNSSSTGGAQLSATGIARLTYDTVVFTASGEKPTATSIVLQGDNVAPGGFVFGQGVRCVTGNLKRLYVKVASGGSIMAPEAGDLAVHERSAALGDAIAPGTQRYYAVYYRDPVVVGGCPGSSTFNITQQLEVLWAP